jgi:hypothetical protein
MGPCVVAGIPTFTVTLIDAVIVIFAGQSPSGRGRAASADLEPKHGVAWLVPAGQHLAETLSPGAQIFRAPPARSGLGVMLSEQLAPTVSRLFRPADHPTTDPK